MILVLFNLYKIEKKLFFLDFLEFIKQIQSANITNLNKNETYAFYINVYNAFASILNNTKK